MLAMADAPIEKFLPLFATDKMTVDLAAHLEPSGTYRDHGVLFRMFPQDLPMLVGDFIEYDL